MVNNDKILEKNKNKYADLLKENFRSLNLLPDEKIAHCIDETDERYYLVGWLVTNKGRIWSLTDKRWLVPWNDEGYWRVANTYVHRLVDFYFMTEEEKRIKRLIDEHNSMCEETEKWRDEVHHLKAVKKFDYSNMTDEEKMLACMEVNAKDNLMLQIKEADHLDAHRIMKGEKTLGEVNGTEKFDGITSILKNSGVDSAYISYDANGKKQYNMTLKLKGMTLEEEKEYDERVSKKFNVCY